MGKRLLQTIMSYESAEYFSNKVSEMPYSGMFEIAPNVTSLSNYVRMTDDKNTIKVVLVNLFEVNDLIDDILISFDKIRANSDRLAVISDIDKLQGFGENLVDFSSLVTDTFIVTDQGIQFEKILNQLNKQVTNQNMVVVLDLLKKGFLEKPKDKKIVSDTIRSENLTKPSIELSNAKPDNTPRREIVPNVISGKQKAVVNPKPKREPRKKFLEDIKSRQSLVNVPNLKISKKWLSWLVGVLIIVVITMMIVNRRPSEQTLINQGKYNDAIGYYHDADKIEDLVMQDDRKDNKQQILLQNKKLKESKYYNLDLAFLDQNYDKVIALVSKMNLENAGNTRLQYIGYSYMKKSNLVKAEEYAEKSNNSKLKEMIKDRKNAYTQLSKIEQGLNGSPSDEQRKVLEEYKVKIQAALANQ